MANLTDKQFYGMVGVGLLFVFNIIIGSRLPDPPPRTVAAPVVATKAYENSSAGWDAYFKDHANDPMIKQMAKNLEENIQADSFGARDARRVMRERAEEAESRQRLGW